MANTKSYTLSQMAQAKELEKSNAAAKEAMDAKKQKKALKLNKSKLTSGY